MRLLEEDVRAIEAVHRQWIAVEKEGNATAVLDYCADDIMWMPPGAAPLRGSRAIRTWLSGPPVLIDEIEISNLAIAGDGRVAWKTCDFVTVSRAAGAGRSTVSRGSHLWILRRQDDGEWRVVLVTWTLV
jgi:ketosteroid isomerase-like protein